MVRFLRSKFKCTEGAPNILRNTNCSRLWQGLSVVWENVRNNVNWSFVHGYNFYFWCDSRIGTICSLINYVTPSIASRLMAVSMAEMVTANGEWNCMNLWLCKNSIVFDKPWEETGSIMERSHFLVEISINALHGSPSLSFGGVSRPCVPCRWSPPEVD
ncbi:hypothetical protein GQ457_05G026030 [Hibiscus cannabinus]